MAYGQRKIAKERAKAEALTNEKIVEQITLLSEEIERGEEYLENLSMKGKSSYQRLDELAEEVYELRQLRSVLYREQNLRQRQAAGLPLEEDED